MTALAPRTGVPVASSRPRRHANWMVNQLPVGMLDSDFFERFVCIFQEVGDTLLAGADNIDNVVDRTVAPPELVRWLGSWIGVDEIDPSLPEDLQRRIVASSAATMTWRGTPVGLQRFLELASEGPATVTDGGGVWRDGDAPADSAWVRMQVESTGWLPESDFVALVRDEVPAHVRAELYVGSRRVWASDEEDTR
jgi:phage tail-like protein